jgi:hypothetical protein
MEMEIWSFVVVSLELHAWQWATFSLLMLAIA